jgi:hypothetical protein
MPVRRSGPARSDEAEAILRLQATAGNAAVTRALRARREAPGRALLQRDVGFEFEIPNSEVREAVGPLTALQASKEVMENHAVVWSRGRSRPLNKGAIWATAPDLEFQADEAGERSDVEIVTTHFPETLAGRRRLEAAVTLAAGLFTEWLTAYGVSSGAQRRPTAHDLVGLPLAVTNPKAFLPRLESLAKPQATVGVRLGRLGTMMRDVFPATDETAAERGRRDPMRGALTSYDTATFQGGPRTDFKRIIEILERAPRLAEASIAAHAAKHREAPGRTDELHSLLTLVYAYLDMGRSGLVSAYAKTIAPVMARTDFATIFGLLDPPNRAYFQADPDRWISLVKTHPDYNWWSLRSALYSGGIRNSTEPNEWYKALRRKDWLRSMAEGTDLLTRRHFPTAQGRHELEALGSHGPNTDAGPAAIFELRALQDMNAPTWRRFALNLFDYVVALNAGNPYTWLANPPPTPPVAPPLPVPAVPPVPAAVEG